MKLIIDAAVLLAAYIIGSIPFGLLVVKTLSGKDIRTVASGRTGGTNAMRAAGPLAGLFTGILDVLKAASTVWLARHFTGSVWIHVFTPITAILGHNYSIFLVELNQAGRLRLRGGAGGAATGGGAFGLWPPIALVLIPVGFLIWFGIGYASITTLSIGILSTLIFTVRAVLGLGPWEYALYGVMAEILMVWALLPNLRRLKAGTERRHGLPVILKQRREAGQAAKDTGKENKEDQGSSFRSSMNKGGRARRKDYSLR
jgi:acyl phosphate:glycerol-3-phosphate acyltransferase